MSMRNKKRSAAWWLTGILLLAGCAAPAASEGTQGQSSEASSAAQEIITVTHELGTVQVTSKPQRVVVFDYGVVDLLQNLEVEIIGLPKASLPEFLKQYRDERYTDVGTLKEPDFEKVFGLKPDLILISTRTQAAYEELSNIAPTLYLTVDGGNYLKSVEDNAALLGKIFGQSEVVSQKVADLKERVAGIQAKVQAKGENALIILANDGSLSAYGKVSRFGIIHHALGFAEADSGIEDSTHGQNVTYEYILEQDPDHLFVIDRAGVVGGDTDAGSTMDNELIRRTKAHKSGTIHYLDPSVWYITSGGFTGTSIMLDEMEAVLK